MQLRANSVFKHWGLSPRVRGEPCIGIPLGYALVIGSIPACAGEPLTLSSLASREGVYPRVCGEPCWRAGVLFIRRVYPRVCGEPLIGSPAVSLLGVYPRVCGLSFSACAASTSALGLSPRVRGNHRACGAWRCRSGSIPACAGEPGVDLQTIGVATSPAGVYPRVCGGTFSACAASTSALGLSPACAGEPSSVWSMAVSERVYPRVCGGTWCRVFPESVAPRRVYPRVCGGTAGERYWNRIRQNGSIPACAGEPEITQLSPRGTTISGLSPRVRGNR